MSLGYFQLIAGLGNPGSKYIKTRHNVGFMALEKLAERESATFSFNKKLFGHAAHIGSGKQLKRLLMPNTYVNESGRSIASAMQWFGLDEKELLIIVDDMDLPLGKLRLREEGGSGGHNGLKSIISHIGSQSFCRLRIGIGSPSAIQKERKSKTVNHVLGRFTKEENQIIEKVLDKVIKGIDIIEELGFKQGSNFINSANSELEA
ncbi:MULTISPECIES: aminoacyl-tRNA hydrolase [unclassified Prochlorococcus]|uniref:aminoacyl-tRNA hydrolase n=1 Tax=unclassified Prochlorococcus TaxID=2627481 RepID=UPI00053372C3|nr:MULTISPECIES: aminoacyl-tRNA hydrolase [unclassified Prochlorococcus]KGG16680.1 Peptidyl-tRNA hydrolase [Prochlorococcus sp. MIT 0602]KGG18348.1 Peptidyl-tRNA hydrolase [Prochlorococcus sp. MIT 0603]